MEIIEVIEPGMLTTVQDTGRYGYMRYGIGTSGAMDCFALRIANILVGNAENEACLEMTMMGPTLRFLSDVIIALSGADLNPVVDGNQVPMYQATVIKQGTTLSFGGPSAGLRGYLAIAGGIDAPVALGSKSTDLKTHIGGVEGRSLAKGDRLSTASSSPPSHLEGRRAPRGLIPTYQSQHLLRVVTGPQNDAFTNKGLETFLNSTYTITPRSDRMGYRLEGPKIEHKESPDIISDGIPFGGVQVAGDGMPIVLMADRGISGGYTKIATVISVDLSELAQGTPGDEVTFKAVSVEQAHEALSQQEHAIEQLKALVSTPRSSRRFKMRVGSTDYNVTVDMAKSHAQGSKTRGHVFLESQDGETYTYAVEAEAKESDA